MSTADQMGLFGEIKPAKPKIRPWRQTKLDLRGPRTPFDLSDPNSVGHAAEVLFDVLGRSREFSRACELRNLPPDDAWIEEFAEVDGKVMAAFVLLRLASDQIEDLESEVLADARKAAARMAELRIELLESVDAEALDDFFKTESRVRTDEAALWREIGRIELGFAEEFGLLGEVEMPDSGLSGEITSDHGLILPGHLDDLMDGFLYEMKEEQDSKPLPKQGKLATLLKSIPVVWLDAVAQCLDVEIEGSRKDREKKIAETLCDPATLRQIVESSLEPAEREILDRLLGTDGKRSAETIYREYGDDEDDGWFWHEEPPTSNLGRLRLHGLVFVGETVTYGRTAMIPKELRAPLGEILGVD